MASSLTHRVAAGALSLALLLGIASAVAGCSGGDDDISKETFLESFAEQSPLNAELDQCIVDKIFEDLDQEQINSFWGEEGTPLSAANTKALEEASSACSTEMAGELAPEAPEGSTEPGTTRSGAQPETTQSGVGPQTTPPAAPPSTTPAG